MSMTSRDTFLNPGDSVIAAPGPGQYDPVGPQDSVKVSLFVIFQYLPNVGILLQSANWHGNL